MNTTTMKTPALWKKGTGMIIRQLNKVLCSLLAVTLTVSSVSAVAGETIRYVHTDHLGTPIVWTDENGNIIKTREYEPYGLQVSGAVEDGPGYTGHVEDAATGLTYMQQRYYDPGIGMFLSVDPVTAYGNPVGQFNRYRYANGNPYKYTDPDGRLTLLAAGIIVIGAIMVAQTLSNPEVRQQLTESTQALVDSVMNNGSQSDPNEGKRDRPLDQPVDLEEDLAGQEIAGKMSDGSSEGIEDISGGMNEERFRNGEASKLRGNHEHPDGTSTEVHGVRDNATGEVSELKFKDRDNARSRGNRERTQEPEQ